MTILLKVLATPIMLVLTVFVWLCSGLIYLSGLVLGLVSVLLLVLAIALFCSSSVEGGIIYLILAFLASPYGLPTAAFWLLGKVNALRYLIREKIYQ